METNVEINKVEVADILNNYSGEFFKKHILTRLLFTIFFSGRHHKH